jgi:hypothetical protein
MPVNRFSQIVAVVLKYLDELSDETLDLYEEAGQVLFQVHAASGGLAPSFALYVKPISQLLPTKENEIRINFSDDDGTIERKIKAGFARLRAPAASEAVIVKAKPMKPDYAARLYGR